MPRSVTNTITYCLITGLQCVVVATFMCRMNKGWENIAPPCVLFSSPNEREWQIPRAESWMTIGRGVWKILKEQELKHMPSRTLIHFHTPIGQSMPQDKVNIII